MVSPALQTDDTANVVNLSFMSRKLETSQRFQCKNVRVLSTVAAVIFNGFKSLKVDTVLRLL